MFNKCGLIALTKSNINDYLVAHSKLSLKINSPMKMNGIFTFGAQLLLSI